MFLLIDVGNCRELCTQSASSISSLQCGGTLLFRYSRHGKLSETLVQSVLATLCLPRRGKTFGNSIHASAPSIQCTYTCVFLVAFSAMKGYRMYLSVVLVYLTISGGNKT